MEILTEVIGRYIHHYDTRRIRSVLKMPPRSFFEKERERCGNSRA